MSSIMLLPPGEAAVAVGGAGDGRCWQLAEKLVAWARKWAIMTMVIFGFGRCGRSSRGIRAECVAIQRVPDVAHQLQIEVQVMQTYQRQCEDFTRFE